jgi:hypothetical protein
MEWGTDISAEAVAAARRRLQSCIITIEQNEIEETDAVSDLVVASEVP